ncbi:hypothetical protein KIN20_029259 [Parelaphostrongylus tenuis]|uniref:Uncharacterized protein n=1 Tax=Parelaphostrongylus tenuis TaxID=148309 RepID=A0AAD5WFG9_PARTN|nr:hypothetical protein KIN20_029259 [Parelaphostrongylus tenuis]
MLEATIFEKRCCKGDLCLLKVKELRLLQSGTSGFESGDHSLKDKQRSGQPLKLNSGADVEELSST